MSTTAATAPPPAVMKDDGYMQIRIDIGDDQTVDVTVDVYEANNDLADLALIHEGEGRELDTPPDAADGQSPTYATALRDYFVRIGFPRLSHRANTRIRDAIYQRCRELVAAAGKDLAA